MRISGITLGAAVGAVLAASAVQAESASSFAEAKEIAARTGKPILVDFFTEW
jgi:hypothetical protein